MASLEDPELELTESPTSLPRNTPNVRLRNSVIVEVKDNKAVGEVPKSASEQDDEQYAANYDRSFLLSRITYSWLTKLVYRARKSKLDPNGADLAMPQHLKAEDAFVAFDEAWSQERVEQDPSLLRCLERCYWRDFATAALVKLCWSACLMACAFFFVRELVALMGDTAISNEDADRRGWLLSVFFFVCCVCLSVAQQQMLRLTTQQGIRVRAALMTAIYRKALRLERAAEVSSDVLNLVSNDSARLQEACTALHYIWASPVEAITIVILLCVLIGEVGTIALGLIAVLLLLQIWMARRVSFLRTKTIKATDVRVRVMTELLSAIKLIKLYAWEDSFFREVTDLRRKERRYIERGTYYKSWNLMSVFSIPPIIALVIFSVYVYLEGKLPSTIAFTTLSLFNTLRFPLVVLPKAIKNLAESQAAMARIQNFLLEPEVGDDAEADVARGRVTKGVRRAGRANSKRSQELESEIGGPLPSDFHRAQAPVPHHSRAPSSQNVDKPEGKRIVSDAPGVAAADLSIGYLKPAEGAKVPAHTVKVLNHVSFEIPAGRKAALVGGVGSGKSSILHAILGEARILRGELTVGGRFAYVPQNPWIQAGTIRENIVFGAPWNQERYDRVVFACALVRDFEIMAQGDMTPLAERGINLSGGQRQRICLARAVYAEADIFLLDNPLSAVDWHTSNHLMEHCINGLLQNKTVIMATHQLYLLDQFDVVMVIKDRTVAYSGPNDPEALEYHMPEFFQKKENQEQDPNHPPATPQTARKQPHKHDADGSVPTIAEASKEEEEEHKVPEKSNGSAAATYAAVVKPKAPKMASDAPKELVPADQRVYTDPLRAWLRAGGIAWFAFTAFTFLITQTNRIISDWWISQWSSNTLGLTLKIYNIIYGALVLGFIINLLIRGYSFYHVALKAATKIHNTFYQRILRAPMSFFTLAPMGQMLNAFSRDQDTVDETLPDSVHLTFIYMLILITTITLVCVVLPMYLIVGGVLVIFTVIMVSIYVRAALSLRKLANNTTAPVFSHLSESLRGISVVRAFRMQDRFMRENVALIDVNSKANFHLDQVSLWLAFRLDIMGSLLVGATAVFCVLDRNTLPSAAAGLAISNSLQALVFYTWFVRGLADIASMFNSVDRIQDYIDNTPQERAALILEHRPKDTWPAQGNIEFKNISMRYLPWLPPALRDVTFSIKHKEKIGVVGRTGSGKSSLIMALYRMYEPEAGNVIVDGEDVSFFGTYDLRSRISIIPQEPVMFHGTIRSNLDPFSRHTDLELWRALEVAHLREMVMNLRLQLESPVEDNGENFSVGQRQLMCLARAFLAQSPVLCLDEATAAMDLATDALIQKTIRKHFKDRTIITIAHRIDTIIHSDRILAMDEGHPVEFDTPVNLLNNPHSFFFQLVSSSGAAYAESLRVLASNPAPVGESDDEDEDDFKNHSRRQSRSFSKSRNRERSLSRTRTNQT